MPRITVTAHDNSTRTIEAAPGLSLMETLRQHGFDDIQAICGGCASCATCHVYVDEGWLGSVGPAGTTEAGMLEFAAAPTDHRSRLACQIQYASMLDGLVVHLPRDQG